MEKAKMAGFTAGALIMAGTVSANEVLELMEAARNSTNILVLDACRNRCIWREGVIHDRR